jgi:23S rRNA (cytosine1962-C5)-methyltransferase
MIELRLKAKKERSVERFHPWIFSGAIHQVDSAAKSGDVVRVLDKNGKFLALGHFQKGASIAVRILSFEDVAIDPFFWDQKMAEAYSYRQQTGLFQSESTNCFRLIHAEGDGLPGLVVDVYGDTAVIQCHSVGMYRQIDQIAEAIRKTLGEKLKAVYNKSRETLPDEYRSSVKNGYLVGEAGEEQHVLENGCRFFVDWEKGQKTGFFLDQRENRLFLQSFVNDKKVLNAFSYSGGFSVYALMAGAKLVHSVDISQKAIDWTTQNIELNPVDASRHEGYTQDVLKFLQATEETYEVMVVDPPAYAKSMKKRHNAVQGYKRLNKLALQKIAPGGLLFTFSCSQVIDRTLFYNTIMAAAIEAKRSVRVMHHLTQPADHPVQLFHPEGSYLKGLVLFVR